MSHLPGPRAAQWLRHWAGLPEVFTPGAGETEEWGLGGVVQLVQADRETVSFVRADGSVVGLRRRVEGVQVEGPSGRLVRRRKVTVALRGVWHAAGTSPGR